MHALAPVPGGPESLRVVWNSSSSTGGRARCVETEKQHGTAQQMVAPVLSLKGPTQFEIRGYEEWVQIQI